MKIHTKFKLISFHKRLLNLTIIACVSTVLKSYSSKHSFSIHISNLKVLPLRSKYHYISLLKAPHIHKDARNSFSRSKLSSLLKITFLHNILKNVRRSTYMQVNFDSKLALYRIINNYTENSFASMTNIPYSHILTSIQVTQM